MPISANVPVRVDWDDVPRGELLQAYYGGKPVLCVRMPGERGEVAVLKSEMWETIPSTTPFDSLDPYPLVLPGRFIVEAVPQKDGSFANTQQARNGNLRVTSDGLASIVVIGSSRHIELVPIGERAETKKEGKHPTDFPHWRIVQVEPGQPNSMGRVVFEHGAPEPAEPSA